MVFAQNRLNVLPANIEPGSTGELSFILENSQEIFGFQLEIQIPEGLDFVTTDGKADIRLSDRAAGGEYSVVSNLQEWYLRIGAFSTSHTAFNGNDGVLFHVQVRASEDFSGGWVYLSNVRLIDGSDNDVGLPGDGVEITAYQGPVTDIQLDRHLVELMPGEMTNLVATVTPHHALDRSVSWSSEDVAVATVDDEGLITAVGVGNTIVTVTANDGSGVSSSCQVIVHPILAESLALSVEEWSGKVGESFIIS